MVINPITDGIVLDHITAGKGMQLYKILNLDELECSVAIIKNAGSKKMVRKDIIKIDKVIDLDFDVLGFIDPGITVSIIKNGKVEKYKDLKLPKTLKGVIACKNPRCITTTEQELPQLARVTDKAAGICRCIYCEQRV